MPAEQRVQAAGVAKGGKEAHERQDHDQRPGRGLGHGEPVQHLAGLQPAQGAHGLLGDIGEHGVRPAEGDDGHLREEHRHGAVHTLAAEDGDEQQRQGRPEAAPQQHHAHGPAERGPGVLELLVEHGIGGTTAPRAWGGGREQIRPQPAADQADDGRTQDDQRERHAEEEDGDEGQRRERHHGPVLERPLADPQDRLDHDREHGGLQPEEQRLDRRRALEQGVDRAQGHDHDEARQHEQGAGDHAAPGTVQQPADVGRELLRLGARQQHAVVQRVQEPRLADPALLLDQDPVHQRDLARRPAEAEQPDLEPGPGGLG